MATRKPESEADRTDGSVVVGEGDADTSRWRRVGTGILGGALLVRGLGKRSLRGIATALVGGWLLSRALGDRREQVLGALPGSDRESAEPVEVRRSVTVGRPAEELYERWRDPEQFSRVVGHVAEVTELDDGRLRWTVEGPRGREFSWETRVVEEHPGERIRWETPPEATVPGEGTVEFEPARGGRGTKVTLAVRFDPPGGAFGTETLERLDVVPEALVGTALRRFKSLAESGEVPTTAGNPSARGTGDLI